PVTAPVRFQIPPPEKTLFGPETLALSPNGRSIAFSAVGSDGRRLLWVRNLDTLEARPLPGTDNVLTWFWSPDDRFLGFGADGKLKKIEVAGGPPQVICEGPDPIVGGSWTGDGVAQ